MNHDVVMSGGFLFYDFSILADYEGRATGTEGHQYKTPSGSDGRTTID